MAKQERVTIGIAKELEQSLRAESGKSLAVVIADYVDTLRRIRAASLQEIKGMFTPGEWMAFAETLNGTVVQSSFRTSKALLSAEVEDAEEMDGTCTRHGANVSELASKIAGLTGAQVDAVLYRVDEFWENEPKAEEWSNF